MAAANSKEEIIKQLEKKARNYLDVSGNCAQSSFLALSKQFSLGDSTTLKALTPFPGIALRGETCGAVVGSLLALGLVYGRDRLDDWEGYLRSLRPARSFCRAFEREFGSTMCSGVLTSLFGRAYNLADPTEAEEWRQAGSREKCSRVVATACRLAAAKIMETQP
jgi:C_GCAxxG_C_C family probable redox protein